MARSRYNFDIAFCIDASEGMMLHLPAVKKQVLRIVEGIKTMMTDACQIVRSMRVRLIVFRSFKYDGVEAINTTEFFDLPQEREPFLSELNAISPIMGGGSRAQSGLEALVYAIRSQWNRGGAHADGVSERYRNLIYLWTCSAACELGEGKENELYPKLGMARTFEELSALWEDEARLNSIVLTLFAPDGGRWRDISNGWSNVIHFPSNAGEGLDDLSFDQILHIAYDL